MEVPMPDIDWGEIAANVPNFNINPINGRRRRNTVGQVLDTIGIELESIALSRANAETILRNLPGDFGGNFNVHRDGSSEINAFFVNLGGGEQVIINSHTAEAETLFTKKALKNILGYELISLPMKIEIAEQTLRLLLPALEFNGDFVSERCATHIHVGGMKKLSFVKNALKLGLWFDEVFYSLAHLDGEKFRGYSNNAIYARPLISGPYFDYNHRNNYYQILNYEAALKAQDLYEFYTCYGADVNGEMQKYHPGRYFSINLYSVPRIETVEFRHFNQSFNANMVVAIAKLCQIFVEVAMKANSNILDSLEIGDVFYTHTPTYYINKLYTLLDVAKSLDCTYYLEKYDIHQLEKIIKSYKGIGIEDKEILTHCRDFEISMDIIEMGHLEKATRKPKPDGHVDIHNIKYQSIIKE